MIPPTSSAIHDAIQQAQTHPQDATEVLDILEALNNRITQEVNELQRRILAVKTGADEP